jgi:hypothetical protein
MIFFHWSLKQAAIEIAFITSHRRMYTAGIRFGGQCSWTPIEEAGEYYCRWWEERAEELTMKGGWGREENWKERTEGRGVLANLWKEDEGRWNREFARGFEAREWGRKEVKCFAKICSSTSSADLERGRVMGRTSTRNNETHARFSN